ncbi:hypothetical protein HF638_12520 [Paenibacillus sp. SZ31]|uniref:hypothetical protein n=1 Tax=Paenibacillus sp. SZ31 TaxID=2725555 RepID=UPI00146A7730|nr:hypothetical protein [Paenibacillus sp. SZ31]NMI04807.1 hypothetical protein [Paenibacillus sp. SZ31]
MSLAISASYEHEHYIAVDTAVSFNRKGISYRNTDPREYDKLHILDGEGYFFSGDSILCVNTYARFKNQPDRSFKKLLSIAKETYSKLADEGDKLAFAKYGFDNDCRATFECMDSSNWDTGRNIFYYGNSQISYITYGAQMQKAMNELDKYKSGDPSIPSFYLPIYEAVANEGVGGSVIFYHLTPEKWEMSSEIPLNEPKNIKKASFSDIQLKKKHTFVGSGADAFPEVTLGEGDGNGFGKAKISKPNGSLDVVYTASNFGRERSVRFKDNGITLISDNGSFTAESKDFKFIATENGSYQLGLSNGSTFELKTSGLGIDIQGDINIKATGNIKMNGARIDLN